MWNVSAAERSSSNVKANLSKLDFPIKSNRGQDIDSLAIKILECNHLRTQLLRWVECDSETWSSRSIHTYLKGIDCSSWSKIRMKINLRDLLSQFWRAQWPFGDAHLRCALYTYRKRSKFESRLIYLVLVARVLFLLNPTNTNPPQWRRSTRIPVCSVCVIRLAVLLIPSTSAKTNLENTHAHALLTARLNTQRTSGSSSRIRWIMTSDWRLLSTLRHCVQCWSSARGFNFHMYLPVEFLVFPWCHPISQIVCRYRPPIYSWYKISCRWNVSEGYASELSVLESW